MAKFITADVSSLKKIGIDKFINESENWPVNDLYFRKIYDEVTAFYGNLTLSVDHNDQKLYLLAYNKFFLGDLVMYIHAMCVFQLCKDKQIKLIYDKRSPYYEFIHHFSNFVSYYDAYKLKNRPLKNRLKLKVKHMLYSRYSKKKNLSIYGIRMDIFPKEVAESCDLFDPNSINFSKQSLSTHKDFLETVLKGIELIIGKFINFEDKSKLEPLYQILIDSLSSFLGFSRSFEKIAHKIKQKNLYVNSLSDIKSRITSLILRNEGMRIIGGVHGNLTFITKRTPTVLSDLQIVDEYYVPSEKSATHLLDSYNLLPEKFYKDPIFKSLDNFYYRGIFSTNQKVNKVQEIKKIMFLEPPLNDYRFSIHRGHFWYNRIREMVKTSKILRDIGYKTIIKRHPDTKRHSENLYNNYFDYQDYGKFEETWSNADAFLFMSLTTTTFGFACTTNRKIILFSPVLDDCFSEPAELLKKRCSIVQANYDEHDRLQYLDRDLLNEIEKDTEENNEYFDQYLGNKATS